MISCVLNWCRRPFACDIVRCLLKWCRRPFACDMVNRVLNLCKRVLNMIPEVTLRDGRVIQIEDPII